MPVCKPGNVAVAATFGESAKFAALQTGVNDIIRFWRRALPNRLRVAEVPMTGVIGPQTATAVHEILFALAGSDYGSGSPVARLAYLGNDSCAIAENIDDILGVLEEELRLSVAPGDRPSALIPSQAAAIAGEKGRTWLWIVGGLALAGVAVGAIVCATRRKRRKR